MDLILFFTGSGGRLGNGRHVRNEVFNYIV
jgi:hypothetical protein